MTAQPPSEPGGSGGSGGSGGPAEPGGLVGLAVGSAAPAFTLPDQHGAPTSSLELLGRGPLVVVFFPYAFSGICTSELREVRASHERVRAYGSELVAVSCDPMFGLRVFAEAEGLEFPLLSDFWPHGEVSSAYAVFDAVRGCAIRGTYLLEAAEPDAPEPLESSAAVVRHRVIHPIGQARSFDETLDALEALAAVRPPG